MNTIAPEERCEACFGTKQPGEMRTPGFAQKIAPPPECPVCNGTAKSRKQV
jgi:hypothetical protein